MVKGEGPLAIRESILLTNFNHQYSILELKGLGKVGRLKMVRRMVGALGFLGEKLGRKESGEDYSGGVEGKIRYTNPCEVKFHLVILLL